LDAVHLATADPFLAELTDFVTFDAELAAAGLELGPSGCGPVLAKNAAVPVVDASRLAAAVDGGS